jgi:hypothetical protein
MNQSTHAWLAIEAYKKVVNYSETQEGKQKKVSGLTVLLGNYLKDVVVAAWLPDSLIKDMTYGHVFKNSLYEGDQINRFKLGKKELISNIQSNSEVAKTAFKYIPDTWWEEGYRVKKNGGHLPARINALSQTIRDMFKMGDGSVVKITGIKTKGSEIIANNMLFTPQNIATMFWMMSHYIADAHMPFHCDNRALASTAKQKTHGEIEEVWGKEVPEKFYSKEILTEENEEILNAEMPPNSNFAGIKFGNDINPLKNNGDPWKEAVFICRASFATSFAIVPPNKAKVDDQSTQISFADILNADFCGEKRFWDISRAIMIDSVNAIAMFWLDAWNDFLKATKQTTNHRSI